MPRRFFRKFAFKRHQLSNQWFMAPFRHLSHDQRIWGISRRAVVPAFALGLFVSWLPFPSHMLAAALTALAFRINIPVATAVVWVSNPLTMAPMYYFAYQVGLTVLGTPARDFSFEISLDWLTNTFVTIWQPLLLGCLILGAATAVIGYVVLDVVWRSSIANYKTAKRRNRSDRRRD